MDNLYLIWVYILVYSILFLVRKIIVGNTISDSPNDKYHVLMCVAYIICYGIYLIN